MTARSWPGRRLRPHLGRDPVGGQHDRGAGGHLVELLDEHRALALRGRPRRGRCGRSGGGRRRAARSARGPARRSRWPARPRRRTSGGRRARPGGHRRRRPTFEGLAHPPQRADGPEAAEGDPAGGGVGDRAHHGEGVVPQGRGQPGRLHVGHQRPGGRQLRRRRPRTKWGEESSGPVTDSRPARRSSAASSPAPGIARTAPVRSPGARSPPPAGPVGRSGSRPPATPTTATAVPPGRRRARVDAAAVARCRPDAGDLDRAAEAAASIRRAPTTTAQPRPVRLARTGPRAETGKTSR